MCARARALRATHVLSKRDSLHRFTAVGLRDITGPRTRLHLLPLLRDDKRINGTAYATDFTFSPYAISRRLFLRFHDDANVLRASANRPDLLVRRAQLRSIPISFAVKAQITPSTYEKVARENRT